VIVQSFGQLQSVRPMVTDFPSAPGYSPDVSWVDEADDSFGEIYATQPNIRICVDFLARNIAQLNIHAYRRISDTDRERLVDHDVIQWLTHPNPSTTMYRLIEDLMGDLGIYFDAYWVKVRYEQDSVRGIGLVRVPPYEMKVVGGLLPTGFLWTRMGRTLPFLPSEIVHFDGYNPLNPLKGLSPMVTLAGLLREDEAATANREAYWKNASRTEGIIERPREAPKWTPEQKQAWREQWQRRYAGPGNAGMVPVLEDGMTFKPTVFSARDSQYTEGGKLRREICAAEYHIPLPMVGILDHATFSNIKEQHKQLYQDSLGPWLTMIVQEIARQLLPEATDQDNVYFEFNIAEKMKGSFEEQASALQTAIGRPIMTPNEGRARLNLPSIKDDPTADQLAPQQGGPSDATANPNNNNNTNTNSPIVEAEPIDAAAAVVEATRARQRTRLLKFPAAQRSSAFYLEIDRWNRELARDLAPIVGDAEAARLALSHNLDLFTELDS
jgi:HK97 family phage portal protein